MHAVQRIGVVRIYLQRSLVGLQGLIELLARKVTICLPALVFRGTRQRGQQIGQFDMAGISGLYAPHHRSGTGRITRGQLRGCLLQQVREHVLAPFQRPDAIGLQLEHALVQRQGAIAAFELARRMCARGHAQQCVDADRAGFGAPQLLPQRIGLRTRHGQLVGELQGLVRPRELAARNRRARLRQRGLAHAVQSGARIGAVGIQRQCGRIELARAAAIGGGEPALGEGALGLHAQPFGAGLRPQPVGQRLPQAEQEHGETQGDGDDPLPVPRAESPRDDICTRFVETPQRQRASLRTFGIGTGIVHRHCGEDNAMRNGGRERSQTSTRLTGVRCGWHVPRREAPKACRAGPTVGHSRSRASARAGARARHCAPAGC